MAACGVYIFFKCIFCMHCSMGNADRTVFAFHVCVTLHFEHCSGNVMWQCFRLTNGKGFVAFRSCSVQSCCIIQLVYLFFKAKAQSSLYCVSIAGVVPILAVQS